MTLSKKTGLFADRTGGVLLSECPNPKPTAADKKAFGRLASLYTAFSGEFATFSLDYMRARGRQAIADPFAGMGTLGEAARALPVQLTLNDFNPFAASASVLRTSRLEDVCDAVEYVLQAAQKIDLEATPDPYHSIRQKVLQEAGSVPAVFESLDRQRSKHAALCLHVLSVTRITAQKKRSGSNPTWTRKQEGKGATDRDFFEALQTTAQSVMRYSENLAPPDPDFSTQISCSDVTDLCWSKGTIDAIITSPPYPNRTDYIKHYLPATELLLGYDECSERALREAQIGTPLIRSDHQSASLPRSVEELIDRILRHPSYASERYYAKGFRYYFEDMANVLTLFNEWLVDGGLAMIVVQDTYYKDVLVRTAKLLSDIAKTVGFVVEDEVGFQVKNSMSRLSPQFRAIMPKPDLFETVLVLRKV